MTLIFAAFAVFGAFYNAIPQIFDDVSTSVERQADEDFLDRKSFEMHRNRFHSSFRSVPTEAFLDRFIWRERWKFYPDGRIVSSSRWNSNCRFGRNAA